MNYTKKNHYTPCFWTAYWNKEYLDSKRGSSDIPLDARNAIIFSLNLKANKILEQKTENSFFQKRAGLTQVSNEEYLEFLKNNTKFTELDSSEDDVIIDFEPFFSALEIEYKSTLDNVIKNRRINNLEEKVYLSFFIVFQTIRNHNYQNQVIKFSNNSNWEKLLYLFDFKLHLSNKDKLMDSLVPLISSKWVLYNIKDGIIPISDNPILFFNSCIYLPLAPDMLLQLSLKKKVSQYQICTNSNWLLKGKYNKVVNETIKNSTREIVSMKKQLLERIQDSLDFNAHLKNIEI